MISKVVVPIEARKVRGIMCGNAQQSDAFYGVIHDRRSETVSKQAETNSIYYGLMVRGIQICVQLPPLLPNMHK